MPNLKHLLEELEELGVKPDKIRIPGQFLAHIQKLAYCDTIT